MDPASIIGITSGIITFIDFTQKFFVLALSIYDERSNPNLGVETLGEVTVKMKDLVHGLISKSSGSDHSQEEMNITLLASQCHDLANDIIQRLERIKVKKRSLIETLKATSRTLWSRNEISRMQDRLDRYANQLNLHLTATMRLETNSNLRALSKASASDAQNIDDIRKLFDNITMIHSDQWAEVLDLLRLSTQHSQKANQNRILNALRCSMTDERYLDISDNADGTYDWILSDHYHPGPDSEQPHVLLKEWLSCGEGIFHVSGKPGSGKSTLMKFICNHPKTMRQLSCWAGDNKLIFSKFFFWRHGHANQRTIKGLVRSLLFDILSQIPDEIASVFPDLLNSSNCNMIRPDSDFTITDRQVRTAFNILISNTNDYTDRRFFFAIDGLDEFDDDDNSYSDLVDLLWKLVDDASGAVKLLVSSRELPIFQARLSSTERIRLQDLTRGDIETVVYQALDRNAYFLRLDMNLHEKCQELKKEIVDRSDGVFLWVVLILKSVGEGLENRATLSKLRKRVTTTPRNIERFFECILESIHETDWKEAYYAFSVLMLIDSRDTFSLLQFSFLADLVDYSNFALDLYIRDSSNSEIEDRLEDASIRVGACCKGLVEIRPSAYSLTYPGISQKIPALGKCLKFTHRTVPDFLDPRMKAFRQMDLRELDVLKMMLESQLAQIKFMPFPTEEEHAKPLTTRQDDSDVFTFCEELAWQLCTPLKKISRLSVTEQFAYFGLLDSLDEALCARQGFLRSKNSLDINWTENWAVLTWNPGRRCADRHYAISILHLTVYLGFDTYLWWKVDQRPDYLSEVSVRIQLFDSIRHGIDRSGPKSEENGPAPGLAMLEKLFHRGLSIYQTPSTNSPARLNYLCSLWEDSIWSIVHTSSSAEEMDILEVFLKMGADPRYQFAVASDDSSPIRLEFNGNTVITSDLHDFPIWKLLSERRDRRCSLREFVEYMQPYDVENILQLIDHNIDFLEHEERRGNSRSLREKLLRESS